MSKISKVKSQKSVKQKLVEAQQNIKQKFACAYNDRVAKERKLNERFKP